ncbi:hypothetical protein [Beijerinckia indica]|uniref:Uncharacterized protein n=1 Tax=Beijerinckia indica subsp. indica (strain ATCC 9039 / DSM 1715 / NCIMB 8712) TaxID=395963 RepID=B2IDP5_BEII9|nr:hypothetical protein [Beijerinckia indica]ACB95481.1 hypothetical protein Bind_1857 [Beijerinckia indica subsp. indica ATCC 9039]
MAATAEDSARYMLTIFQRHNSRKGDTLLVGNFTLPFSQDGWTLADYDAGKAFAIEKGWVKLGKSEQFFTLTEEGLAAAA